MQEGQETLQPEASQILSDLEHQFRLLLQSWNQLVGVDGHRSCSTTAVLRPRDSCLVQIPDSVRGRGRPPTLIDGDQIIYLRACGFTWTKIAEMHLVNRSTIWRRCQGLGIPTSRLFIQFVNWSLISNKFYVLEVFPIFQTTIYFKLLERLL